MVKRIIGVSKYRIFLFSKGTLKKGEEDNESQNSIQQKTKKKKKKKRKKKKKKPLDLNS